jgi:hypothetical protein
LHRLKQNSFFSHSISRAYFVSPPRWLDIHDTLRSVLGHLEVKAISRLAAQRGPEWKPIHTAVMGCLLAHRNRRTGSCFPERRLLAAHCNVKERTIDRVLAQLTEWGAIERHQLRTVSSQKFREAQYTFLFELPSIGENPSESGDKNCANKPSRATNSGGAVRQKQAEPCDKNGGLIRKKGKIWKGKIEGKDLTPHQNIARKISTNAIGAN